MRFIKKTNYKNLAELSNIYKEYELFLCGEDIGNYDIILEEARRAYEEQSAIITSVHCPESIYQTPLGEKCVNYMSWGEIVETEYEKKRFF